VYQLLLSMQKLQKNNQAYHHIVSFFSTCLISKLS
jgi:hypothetical protein